MILFPNVLKLLTITKMYWMLTMGYVLYICIVNLLLLYELLLYAWSCSGIWGIAVNKKKQTEIPALTELAFFLPGIVSGGTDKTNKQNI